MIRLDRKQKFTDRRLFFIIFALTFTIFIFTTDGHRNTFDEDTASQQALRIATWSPHPEYVQGESTLWFEYERFKNNTGAPVCINCILCSTASIPQSLTQMPFILINEQLNILTSTNTFWTEEDFNEPHYVWWRNSIPSSLIFMELFYGPVISALSVGIFFLVCRTFNFNQRVSITLAILFGFTTILWAYSQTSLNSVPSSLFVLTGFYFVRKFICKTNYLHLTLGSIFLGLAFLTRQDAIFFIVPIFFYLILYTKKSRIKKIIFYSIPLALSYGIHRYIPSIRFDNTLTNGEIGNLSNIGFTPISSNVVAAQLHNQLAGFPILTSLLEYPLHIGGFGLLFSPGLGLLIFCPVLLLIFLSFPDFFKRNKPECILFIVFFGSFIFHYGTLDTWHGLVAWGPRYLLPLVPFLILTIGACIEKRQHFTFKSSLIILGAVGILINISYLVQDVTWFVWGWPGTSGLYGIDKVIDGVRNSLNLDPAVFWTFEYSQLTHAIFSLSTFQSDILLVKILSLPLYIITFTASFGIILYSLVIRNLLLMNKNAR